MVMINCGTCEHWTPPKLRTDFKNAIGYSYSVEDSYEKANAVDKKFGICKKITMERDLEEHEPIPLAATLDASEYQADLYTQAEFMCSLWKEKDEQPKEAEGES